MKDYYEILKVTRDAPAEVIKVAYEALVLKYHPDTSVLGKEEATKRMKELNEAYAVLSDEKKRREYDSRYGKGGSSGTKTGSSHGGGKTKSGSGDTPPTDIELAKVRFSKYCEQYTTEVKNIRIKNKTDFSANVALCRKLQKEFFSNIAKDYILLLQENQLTGCLEHVYMETMLRFCDEFIKWNGYSNVTDILKIASNHKDCDEEIKRRYTDLSNIVVQSNVKVGDHVYFGRYQGEQIEWRVLAERGGRKLLITEYGIDAKAYNTEFEKVTWADCTLRQWLNDSFFRECFNSSEQEKIVSVDNDNSDNPIFDNLDIPIFGTKGGRRTNDRVFLLSFDEVKDYFRGDQDRQCSPTAYAKRQGACVNEEGYCWWWLRSPGACSDNAACVYYGGFVDFDGDHVAMLPMSFALLCGYV